MSGTPGFWDASALAPLCVPQPTTQQARTWLRQFIPVVWWATPVEVHSAITRLQRSGELGSIARQTALNQLAILRSRWQLILPTDTLRNQAETLLDLYPLRAADSLQLAAALMWCRNRPAGRIFLCADARLSEAAGQAGFTVLSP